MAKTRTPKKTPAAPQFEPRDYVMVRHVVSGRRDDFERIFDMIESPYESGSSMSVTGTISTKKHNFAPADRWLLVAKFKNLSWLPLYSNHQNASEIFEQLAARRRFEVVQYSCDPQQKFVFRFAAKGQEQVDFHAQLNGKNWEGFNFKNASLGRKVFDCLNGQQALDVLCKHFELSFPIPMVRADKQGFEVIGRTGKKVRTGMTAFKIYQAFGLPGDAGDKASKAARMLDRALDKGDPERVSEAVEAGAPLDRLPECSLSPLMHALFRCGRVEKWEECAQILVDAGASISDSGGNGEPLIVVCCDHLVDATVSRTLVEFLIKNGAPVDEHLRGGKTALFNAALLNKTAVVKVLLAAGADPSLRCSRIDNLSIAEFVRHRMEADLEFQTRTPFSAMLELLTGEKVEVPIIEPLAPELQGENDRFKQVEEAVGMLKFIPDKAEFQTFKISRLSKFKDYKPWAAQLEKMGFVEACHCSIQAPFKFFQSAWTHPTKHFDAVFSDSLTDGDLIRLELGAWLDDGTCTVVGNLPTTEGFHSRIINIQVAENAAPAELVRLLEKASQKKKLKSIQPENYFERLKNLVERELVGVRQAGQDALDEFIVMDNGALPRFEVTRFYLPTWDPDKYPDHSSAKLAQSAMQALQEEIQGDNGFDFECAVGEAALLTLMRHFQFAGAPTDASFLPIGSRRAVQLFQLLANKPRAFDFFWGVENLAQGLLLAALADQWSDVEAICSSLKPRFADPKNRSSDDPPVAIAQLELVIASSFRKKPIQGAKSLPEKIRGSRSREAKLLLDVWEAIEEGNQLAFDKGILKSLCTTIKKLKKKGYDSHAPYDRAAWLESLLAAIAVHRGMVVPDFPVEQAAWLLSHDTVC